jgi:hypothetical protein
MRKPRLAPGEWVILKNNKIVEHNRDIGKILELANKYKDNEITISKEPAGKYCFY